MSRSALLMSTDRTLEIPFESLVWWYARENRGSVNRSDLDWARCKLLSFKGPTKPLGRLRITIKAGEAHASGVLTSDLVLFDAEYYLVAPRAVAKMRAKEKQIA